MKNTLPLLKRLIPTLALAVMMLTPIWGWGQILTFEFSALVGSEITANSNSNDANLTSSTISRGVGLTASGNGGRFNATSWALTSIANAVSGNDYMEFTITPQPGFQFSVSSIYIQLQRSPTGPSGVALRSSVDSYAANLDEEYAIVDNTSTQNFTFTFSQTNSSSPVTYRIYMWAEADGGSGGIGDGSGDDIIVTGTTSSTGGSTPLISLNPTSLTGFTYVEGFGPSGEQTFTVSGSDLTEDISIAATTNYEISTGTGASFSPTNPITLTQTSGTVEETTIYVRLKAGLSAGVYNDEGITATSAGADNKTVTCSGYVSRPIGWANLQWPVSGNISTGSDFDVYGRVYASGVTEAAGADTEMQAWVGYSTENTNPNTWNNWVEASWIVQVDNNDEYKANIGVVIAVPGTYYYATRFQLDGGPYSYGGYSVEGGGFWDGSTYVSNVLMVSTPEPNAHVTEFSATANSYSKITVSWTDSDADSYLIKGSDVSYAEIIAPVDGTAEVDGELVKNVASGLGTYQFTSLDESTTYYFKIYPYNGSDAAVNYKTDGSVPEATATTDEAPPLPAIYFSEYIEGSGNNKAIEIYNGTGSAIDLSLLTINLYSGGSLTAGNTYTGTGSLVNGQTFIIANSSAIQSILDVADITAGVTFYNGDDALELVYNGQTIDVIGVIGEDPGTAWSVAGTDNATAEYTLIRKLNVTTGNTDWAASAGTDATDSEWVVKAQDYIGNLSYVGTVWQGTTTAWTEEANWDMGVPSIYQAWVVSATETPVVSTTETASDVIVLDNNLHISPTGFLTVDNLLGIIAPGVVTVEPLGQLSGEIFNLGTDASLIIQSDATGTGSVIPSVSGNPATVQRYLTGGWDSWDAGWHQISSPVAAQAISAFETTGTGNGYDFYGWDEPSNMWMNYKDAGFSGWNVGTSFNVGQGYLVSYEAANTTQTFTGLLNTADVLQSNLSTNGGSDDGWHLLGNPFASALIWNETVDNHWALSNVAGTAKIWHEANKSYSDIAANGIIPSAQGFMVQVSSASNGIIIPAASRVHNAQPFYKSGNEQLLLVAAETEGGSAQESKIMVNPMATEGFDFDYDSRFLAGYAPTFYSVAGDELLSTNSFPSIDAGLVIPFGFVKNAASSFSIQLKESMEGRVVYLTDTKTGTVSNLTETPVYSFTSSDGDDANRFLLSFGTLGINNPAATDGVQVYAFGEVLYIGMSSKEAAQVNVYNLTGQLVMQGRTGGNTLSTFNTSALGTGIYVVNVVMGNQVISRKVAIRN